MIRWVCHMKAVDCLDDTGADILWCANEWATRFQLIDHRTYIYNGEKIANAAASNDFDDNAVKHNAWRW